VALEVIPASRKLSQADAAELLKSARKLVVAKGKKISEWKASGLKEGEAVEAMLGPTGNLRAPTLRVGTTLIVGFNEEVYSELLT
jgi:hypothetical protein